MQRTLFTIVFEGEAETRSFVKDLRRNTELDLVPNQGEHVFAGTNTRTHTRTQRERAAERDREREKGITYKSLKKEEQGRESEDRERGGVNASGRFSFFVRMSRVLGSLRAQVPFGKCLFLSMAPMTRVLHSSPAQVLLTVLQKGLQLF